MLPFTDRQNVSSFSFTERKNHQSLSVSVGVACYHGRIVTLGFVDDSGVSPAHFAAQRGHLDCLSVSTLTTLIKYYDLLARVFDEFVCVNFVVLVILCQMSLSMLRLKLFYTELHQSPILIIHQ